MWELWWGSLLRLPWLINLIAFLRVSTCLKLCLNLSIKHQWKTQAHITWLSMLSIGYEFSSTSMVCSLIVRHSLKSSLDLSSKLLIQTNSYKCIMKSTHHSPKSTSCKHYPMDFSLPSPLLTGYSWLSPLLSQLWLTWHQTQFYLEYTLENL